jgi:hypothetical protein
LSAAIKNDPEITGVNLKDSEFLLSQYADDSSLILEEMVQNCKIAKFFSINDHSTVESFLKIYQ